MIQTTNQKLMKFSEKMVNSNESDEVLTLHLYVILCVYIYIYVILIGGFKHVLFSISYMG